MWKPSEPASRRVYAEDAPTQVDDLAPAPPRVSAPPSSPTPETISDLGSSRGASGSSSLVTADETLGLQEATRTRMFLYVAIGLATSQAAALLFVEGDAIAKAVFLAALSSVVASSFWLVIKLRADDMAYTVERGLVVAYATIFAAFSGIYFYGVFSPAPVIVPVGVQFYCSGQSDKASVSVIATCSIAYALLAGLIMAGIIPDAGIVNAQAASPASRVVMLLLVEVIFAAVYVTARATRGATLHAIEQHDIVIQSLAQREALLREAKHELVHAMRVGGIGRYSGEMIGPFRLGNLIGRGAMGEVYEAVKVRPPGLESLGSMRTAGASRPSGASRARGAPSAADGREEAAVKLIHPQLLAEEDVVERFLREAEVTSSLSVPNVVRVIETSPPNAPLPYLAMERLRGEDLASFLRENKRMGLRKLTTMVRQVAAGLDAAHAAGIVHRDLKPRNLFCAQVESDEVWKILDFGVSKLMGAEGTLTHGQIVGTPGYMSPEQARGRTVGPRSDIFSLGVVVYRALTGVPPISAETSLEILAKIANEQPARPSDLVKLPEDVDLVLALALAKDPKDRFASAGDLSRALDAATRGPIDPRLAARARSLILNQPWNSEHSS